MYYNFHIEKFLMFNCILVPSTFSNIWYTYHSFFKFSCLAILRQFKYIFDMSLISTISIMWVSPHMLLSRDSSSTQTANTFQPSLTIITSGDAKSTSMPLASLPEKYMKPWTFQHPSLNRYQSFSCATPAIDFSGHSS